jgi:hypothetical protein
MTTISALGFDLIVVTITGAATSILSIGSNMMTYAQDTSTTPETVFSQGNVTGTQNTTAITSTEEADDEDDVEEGPGEDDDEPGDIDLNDKED